MREARGTPWRIKSDQGHLLKTTTPRAKRKPDSRRRPGVFIRLPEQLTRGVRDMAASRRVPIHAIFEAALAAYLSPSAQDQRDALLGRHINRLSRVTESVDWNTKLLIAMLRYLIELQLSFLPETTNDEEREAVAEKGARRFDRFEQWLTRHLVDPDNLYQRIQARFVAQEADFADGLPLPCDDLPD